MIRDIIQWYNMCLVYISLWILFLVVRDRNGKIRIEENKKEERNKVGGGRQGEEKDKGKVGVFKSWYRCGSIQNVIQEIELFF